MTSIFSKLIKYVELTVILCLLLTGMSHSSAEEIGFTSAKKTGFINTLPLYSPETDSNPNSETNVDDDTILGTLTLPLYRVQGDENTLYTGTVKLTKKALDSIKIESHPAPRVTQTDPDDGFPPDIAEKLQDLLENTVNDDRVPSAIILVNYHGKMWRGVAGKARVDDKPQVFSNKFRAGSTTKMFVASILLALIQDPKNNLTLDSTMELFKDESWYSDMPNREKITIRQLLGHQSGLYDYANKTIAISYQTPMKIFTPEELLAYSFDEGSLYEPGTKYNYSNTNYILAGLLIEKITDRSVAENINSRILIPTGMFNTLFPDDADIPYDYSHGYTYDFNYLKDFVPRDVSFRDPSEAWASGAIISNITDLEFFTRLQALGKLSPSEELSKSLQKERSKFVALSNIADINRVYDINQEYEGCKQENSEKEPLVGLGIFCFYGYLGHEGLIPGYNTSTYYRPDETNADKGIGITISLNSDVADVDAGGIFLEIVAILDNKNYSPKKRFLSDGKLPDGRTIIQALLGIKADEKVIPYF